MVREGPFSFGTDTMTLVDSSKGLTLHISCSIQALWGTHSTPPNNIQRDFFQDLDRTNKINFWR